MIPHFFFAAAIRRPRRISPEADIAHVRISIENFLDDLTPKIQDILSEPPL